MAIEIVDFPIKKKVIFHRFLYVYRRGMPCLLGLFPIFVGVMPCFRSSESCLGVHFCTLFGLRYTLLIRLEWVQRDFNQHFNADVIGEFRISLNRWIIVVYHQFSTEFRNQIWATAAFCCRCSHQFQDGKSFTMSFYTILVGWDFIHFTTVSVGLNRIYLHISACFFGDFQSVRIF